MNFNVRDRCDGSARRKIHALCRSKGGLGKSLVKDFGTVGEGWRVLTKTTKAWRGLTLSGYLWEDGLSESFFCSGTGASSKKTKPSKGCTFSSLPPVFSRGFPSKGILGGAGLFLSFRFALLVPSWVSRSAKESCIWRKSSQLRKEAPYQLPAGHY